MRKFCDKFEEITKFGYPKLDCKKCKNINIDDCNLKVLPSYIKSQQNKLMLIGQDPTIFKNPERVKYVLMLNEDEGQLSQWLKSIFGENFDNLTIYATNLVKCTFFSPPSTRDVGSVNFLKPYFENCKDYLMEEINNYRPDIVLTLGEPTHKLFCLFFDKANTIQLKMKEAFTGEFMKIKTDLLEFDYSPCLHIKTFRVAETYG